MPSVDIGAESYDTFADVEFADAYLAGDVMRATLWALRNLDTKGRGLVSATRMLLALPWCEETPDPAAEAVPILQEVTSMLASDLLANPKLFADASGAKNIKSVKAGSAQVEFFSPVAGGPPIPTMLWNRLLNAGLVCLGKAGDAVPNDGAFVSGISDGCRPLGGRYPWDWPIAALDTD